MSCVHPLDGYRVASGLVTIVSRGDRPPRNATTRVPIPVPCQKCIGCRMEYARQWGLRCLHEAKMWPANSFVTLTYNDASLPLGGSLCLRDVQLFMKRLRKAREPDRIRFFLGGEYGDRNKRPHYHALLFNCGFPDRVRFGVNARGETVYTSRELSNLWSVDGVELGFCTIGEVSYDSAVYCAKYALKKVNGDKAYEHYGIFNEDGEWFDRTPEFALMSTRGGGIGKPYLDKYGSEIVAHDNVVVEGRGVPVPRYYKLKLAQRAEAECAREDSARLEGHRRARKRAAVLNKADNTPERLRVKEKLKLIAAQKKERKL